MNNIMRLRNNGCFTYINLDKVMSIQFYDDKMLTKIFLDSAVLKLRSLNIESFKEIKIAIDEAMEKRIIQ